MILVNKAALILKDIVLKNAKRLMVCFQGFKGI